MVCLHTYVFVSNPIRTGKRTTFIVERTRSEDCTDLATSKLPASFEIRNGVMNTAAKVDAVVIIMDNARSPFAIRVTYIMSIR